MRGVTAAINLATPASLQKYACIFESRIDQAGRAYLTADIAIYHGRDLHSENHKKSCKVKCIQRANEPRGKDRNGRSLAAQGILASHSRFIGSQRSLVEIPANVPKIVVQDTTSAAA